MRLTSWHPDMKYANRRPETARWPIMPGAAGMA